jgi:hypothetical protein
MKVKPAVPGSVVRFPSSRDRILKDEGEDVPDENYWHRRLRDGSVVLVDGAPTGREPVTPLTTR